MPGQEVDQRDLERVCAKRLSGSKLNREDDMDRSRWRKQIRMVDDQDRCELVNVSSGIGSPR